MVGKERRSYEGMAVENVNRWVKEWQDWVSERVTEARSLEESTQSLERGPPKWPARSKLEDDRRQFVRGEVKVRKGRRGGV